mmetsp:Transcript_7213/g.18831  ORF Transcript_7213/g.18831 Transcript_7213/m.18831 type:complete len:165 (-) Transcript_7213:290-784(-)
MSERHSRGRNATTGPSNSRPRSRARSNSSSKPRRHSSRSRSKKGEVGVRYDDGSNFAPIAAAMIAWADTKVTEVETVGGLSFDQQKHRFIKGRRKRATSAFDRRNLPSLPSDFEVADALLTLEIAEQPPHPGLVALGNLDAHESALLAKRMQKITVSRPRANTR